MKKTILFLIAAIILVPLFAQEKIAVPKMTDVQKHQRVNFMFNYMFIMGADYAKSQGQTVEDFAKHMGELSKTTWDSTAGFKGFIKGTLYNWESWRSSTSPQIQIMKQTNEEFQFKTPLDIKKILGDKTYHEVSFQELMTAYNIVFEIVAKHLGVKYEQKLIEDGNWLEITITK